MTLLPERLPKIHAFLFAALLTAVAGGAVPSALAAPQDGQKFQDWVIRCEQNPADPAAQRCFMAHQVSNNQTNQTVMVIAIGYTGPDNTLVAVVTLPLGVRLPPGIMVQVDQAEGQAYPFERCAPDGCQVQFRMSEAVTTSFKNGNSGRVFFKDPKGQNVAFPFSLSGFTAALNSLK